MLAWRTTWIVKPGRLDEALAALAAVNEKNMSEAGLPPTFVAARAYSPSPGPTNMLVFEEVWSTVEAHNQWWDGYRQTPGHDAFFATWDQIVERSTSSDVWEVAEWRA
jgi:hypothetical protein